MTQRRLPAGFNTADENDIIQKGPGGIWYTRGPGEIVVPNIVVGQSDGYVMPSRLGPVVTVEVNTSAGSWSAALDSITLSSAALSGDVVRVVDVGGSTDSNKEISILPGSGTIDGSAGYTLSTPFSMVVFYRTSGGNWAVLSQGQNTRTQRLVNGSLALDSVPAINGNYTLYVSTTGLYPDTGGTITLPTTSRRGIRITVVEISGNAQRKEIVIDPGAGTINGSSSNVTFNNPYGSITLENIATATWIVVSSSAFGLERHEMSMVPKSVAVSNAGVHSWELHMTGTNNAGAWIQSLADGTTGRQIVFPVMLPSGAKLFEFGITLNGDSGIGSHVATPATRPSYTLRSHHRASGTASILYQHTDPTLMPDYDTLRTYVGNESTFGPTTNQLPYLEPQTGGHYTLTIIGEGGANAVDNALVVHGAYFDIIGRRVETMGRL